MLKHIKTDFPEFQTTRKSEFPNSKLTVEKISTTRERIWESYFEGGKQLEERSSYNCRIGNTT